MVDGAAETAKESANIADIHKSDVTLLKTLASTFFFIRIQPLSSSFHRIKTVLHILIILP